MNKQRAKQPASAQSAEASSHAAAQPEPCVCREVLAQLSAVLGISPEAQLHFNNSRIEFLKGVRALIDQRIEHLSSPGRQGTKISVE